MTRLEITPEMGGIESWTNRVNGTPDSKNGNATIFVLPEREEIIQGDPQVKPDSGGPSPTNPTDLTPPSSEYSRAKPKLPFNQIKALELIERYRRGEHNPQSSATELFCAECWPLIKRLARRFPVDIGAVSQDDLIQEALIAVSAIPAMFDPNKASLITLVFNTIRHAQADLIRDEEAKRGISKGARMWLDRIKKAEKNMGEEAKEAVRVILAEWQETKAGKEKARRFFGPSGSTEIASLEALDEDGRSPAAFSDTVDQAAREAQELKLVELISQLPARLQTVLILKNGLFGLSLAHSHAEIGEILGVSEDRIQQLQREALNKLRASPDVEMLALE